VYFPLALLVGAAIGLLACLPQPQGDARKWAASITLGIVGAFAGWTGSVLLGEDQVGPFAQLFVAVVTAGALVSVYQAWTSEPAGLR
jgi:uncharacterized membrane protein YeaQ/YmgE (transglycosylase-associated protein family)